jgi:hypothetical protein
MQAKHDFTSGSRPLGLCSSSASPISISNYTASHFILSHDSQTFRDFHHLKKTPVRPFRRNARGNLVAGRAPRFAILKVK